MRYLGILSILLVSTIHAGNYLVKGTVIDGATNEPLAFANIVIIETDQGHQPISREISP